MTNEEAIKRIREHQIIHQTKEPRAIFITEALDMAIEALKAEPKRGEWRHYEGELTCSVCGASFYDDIMEYCGDEVPKFCPNCGAKMFDKDTDVSDKNVGKMDEVEDGKNSR